LQQAGSKLLLPVDTLVAKTPDVSGAPGHVVPIAAVPADEAGVDIGPGTVAEFKAALAGAKTVLWNGPMGVFEIPPFDAGTRAVAEALAAATARGARTVVGGGDTAAAAEVAGVAQNVTHVSTGGGAALEFLEGQELPGVAALSPAK
jgi:phosphoglycerate kinase